MTAVETPLVEWATPAEREEVARQLYRQHLAEGERLTGAELGAHFGRSARWGRYRIAEARKASVDPAGHVAGDSSGSQLVGSGGSNGSSTGDRDGRSPTVGSPVVHDQPGGVDQPQPDGSHATTNGSHGRTAAAPPVPVERDTSVQPGWAVRATTGLAVLAVAAVAAVVSFEHQRQVAALAGEGWRSWLLPVSVDGLVVAASMCLLTARRSHQRPNPLAVVALLLGLGASLGANVVAADPTLVDPAWLRRVVAAWPPLALGVSFELFLQLTRTESEKGSNQ